MIRSERERRGIDDTLVHGAAHIGLSYGLKAYQGRRPSWCWQEDEPSHTRDLRHGPDPIRRGSKGWIVIEQVGRTPWDPTNPACDEGLRVKATFVSERKGCVIPIDLAYRYESTRHRANIVLCTRVNTVRWASVKAEIDVWAKACAAVGSREKGNPRLTLGTQS